MALDDHGKLAAATIAFYVPYFAIALFLTLRHGFRRDAGWIFLLIFSLVRILSGIMLVVAESRPFDEGLYVAAFILNGIGLSPLLLGTIGFLRTVGRGTFGETTLATRAYRLLGLLAIVALVLSIIGGTELTTPSDASKAQTLRRVGSFLFVAMFVGLVVMHLWAWTFGRTLAPHHRTLLAGISCALPFLAVRLVYTVLSVYAGTAFLGTASSSPSSLEKFNVITGTWWIFLIMALLMEYIVVGIYMLVGTMIPISKENPAAYDMEMQHAGNSNGYAQPQYAAPPGTGYRR